MTFVFALLSVLLSSVNYACDESTFEKQVKSSIEYQVASDFVEMLIEKQIVSEADLQAWAFGTSDLIAPSRRLTSNSLRIFAEGFDFILDRLSSDEKSRLRAQFRTSSGGPVAEDTVQDRVPFHYSRVMIPLKAGDYEVKPHLRIRFTNSTEVRSTLVTQLEWFEVMNEIPSTHSTGPTSIKIAERGGEPIILRPLAPVESISWWSSLVFLNTLSERDGLEPVYDLSGIAFDPSTSAAKGTLRAINESEAALRLRIRAPRDNIYWSEGYRLPTAAEAIVFQKLVHQNFHSIALNVNTLVHEAFVLHAGNAPLREPREVTAQRPVLIEDQSVWDGLGNVSILVSDLWSAKGFRTGLWPTTVVNPYAPPQNLSRLSMGPDYTSHMRAALRDLETFYISPQASERRSTIGLRIFRTSGLSSTPPIITLPDAEETLRSSVSRTLQRIRELRRR